MSSNREQGEPEESAAAVIGKAIEDWHTKMFVKPEHLRLSQREFIRVRLAEAGLLVTPQASSAERSEEDLIERISRWLQRDFRLRIGPNTRRHIVDGQVSILLSFRECDDVARAAVAAYRQVVRDGP